MALSALLSGLLRLSVRLRWTAQHESLRAAAALVVRLLNMKSPPRE